MIYKNKISNSIGTILRVKKNWVERKARIFFFDLEASLSSHHQPHLRPNRTHYISWAKPLEGFIKINFDKSKSSSPVTEGFVVQSWDRRFLQAKTFNLRVALVLVA